MLFLIVAILGDPQPPVSEEEKATFYAVATGLDVRRPFLEPETKY